VADEQDLRARLDEMDRSISEHFVEMRDFIAFSISSSENRLRTELRAEMNKRFDSVDRRFDAVDKRFDAVDKRFAAVDKRFDATDRRFDRIEDKLDRVLSGRPVRRRRPKRG
jgi:tetrahydromethanopterin S-methyltransferase subunit G